MGKRSNGEGTIYKRNDGKWSGQITIDIGFGQTKRKTVYGKSQKEVKEKISKLIEDSNKGKVIETSDMPLEQWMMIWISEYKQNLKVTTRENYQLYIEIHIKGSEIGKIPIGKIKATDLQKFYNAKLEGKCKGQKRKLSSTSVRYLNIIIAGALKQAYRNRMINFVVSDAIVLPHKKRNEILPLSSEEVNQFLKVAHGDRLYTLYVLEMLTGLRRGEILGLKWEDIDLMNKRIVVKNNLCRIINQDTEATSKYKMVLLSPKTEKSKRSIPINDYMVTELIKHKKVQEEEKKKVGELYKDLGMVFCKEDGNYIYPRDFVRQYQKILKKAGVENKRFHDLRHTVASLLINANENPKVIQELLGHSTISTTMDIYAHVLDETKDKSIEKLYNQLNLK